MAHLPHGLTVGLIAGSNAIWRWQYQLIQSLMEKSEVDVRAIFVLGDTDFSLDKSIAVLHRLDGKIFSSPVDAFEMVDVSMLSTTLVSGTEAAAASSGVDVLINFSEAVIPEYLIQKTKFGVLTPQFSDDGVLSSQSLGIKQYLMNQKQVCLCVINKNSDGSDLVLATARPSFDSGSLCRNLEKYWVWQTYLWACCLDIISNANQAGAVSLGNESFQTPAKLKENEYENLSLGQTAGAFIQLSVSIQQKLKQKYLHQEQWGLLFKSLKKDKGGLESLLDFSEYQELSPPEDRFWADPFVLSKDDRDYIFFEELPFATEVGHLCCMEVFEDGTHTDPVIIIQELHHLSYPNVFEYESEYYLIPESGDNGKVDLYRCTEFPYQWEYHKTLIDNLHAYDSTLLEYQGRWWLFATVVPELGLSACEELHIFHADSPDSTDWQPHLNNPVIRDASYARPGGNFYTKGEQVYRVSQDCAGQYGAGINLSQIVRLNDAEYEETIESHHYPDWDKKLIALHTFNYNKNIAVADVQRVKRKSLIQ